MFKSSASAVAIATSLGSLGQLAFRRSNMTGPGRRTILKELNTIYDGKYPGEIIRQLTAERGCGCQYNKRRRAALKEAKHGAV